MTTLKVGDHVIRTDKYDKRNTEHHIRTERELAFHNDLQAQGYEYTVVGAKRDKPVVAEAAKNEFDFDLPEEKNGLRIHRARPEDCESCSA